MTGHAVDPESLLAGCTEPTSPASLPHPLSVAGPPDHEEPAWGAAANDTRELPVVDVTAPVLTWSATSGADERSVWGDEASEYPESPPSPPGSQYRQRWQPRPASRCVINYAMCGTILIGVFIIGLVGGITLYALMH